MKPSTTRAVPIEPEPCERTERALNAEFIKRGIASLNAARCSGRYVTAASVVRELEDRLAKARAGMRQREDDKR